MDGMIRGLHHVTATVNDAQSDLNFYSGLLGQRLVKKTVNFDNPFVYHFYYGNEAGTPGTIMTTFPYKGMGVRVGTKGFGQINLTSFSAPAASLAFWRTRLNDAKITFVDARTPFGEEALSFADTSGLRIRIVGAAKDERPPWTGEGMHTDHAIRGIHSVQLHAREPRYSVEFLTRIMDATVVHEAEGITRLSIGDGMPGQLVEVVNAADQAPAVNGLGTVHHVAFAVATSEEQLRMREALLRVGAQVTDVRDRQYFTSIYFREPNGILFEIATLPPGFAVDEPLDSLGRALKLPPWEEPRRAEIQANLPDVMY